VAWAPYRLSKINATLYEADRDAEHESFCQAWHVNPFATTIIPAYPFSFRRAERYCNHPSLIVRIKDDCIHQNAHSFRFLILIPEYLAI